MRIKTQFTNSSKTIKRLFGYSIVLLLSIIAVAPRIQAQDLTQGFLTSEKLLRGAVVARGTDDKHVESATFDNIDRLYGAVIRSNETALSLSSDPGEVFVATTGRYEMLVSDVNGPIKNGDYLTVSPIAGIAMRADDRQSRVVALALQDFDTSNPANILTTTDVKTADGQVRNVAIGRVLADLDVKNNPLAFGIRAPEVLIEIGQSIAGGPVSVTRVWGALIVTVLSFLTGSVIFYAGVRTSIIAIGRNPLSKSSVLKGFLQITLISLAIFATGGFAVYLILKI